MLLAAKSHTAATVATVVGRWCEAQLILPRSLPTSNRGGVLTAALVPCVQHMLGAFRTIGNFPSVEKPFCHAPNAGTEMLKATFCLSLSRFIPTNKASHPADAP